YTPHNPNTNHTKWKASNLESANSETLICKKNPNLLHHIQIIQSKQAKQHKHTKQDQPNNVNQQKGLARWARPTIAHITYPHLHHPYSAAVRIGAPAPVRHAVGSTNRVGLEAINRT
ncbi:hypothetical protein ABTP16_01390, partial [Acinetobacter baumannii]